MLLFLLASSEADLPRVIEVLNAQRILDNDLSDIGVAIEKDGVCCYAHPPRLAGSTFRLRADRAPHPP